MRSVCLLLLLGGCVIQQPAPTPAEKPASVKEEPALHMPVSNSCVESWYVKPFLPLPDCVETYLKACNAHPIRKRHVK